MNDLVADIDFETAVVGCAIAAPAIRTKTARFRREHGGGTIYPGDELGLDEFVAGLGKGKSQRLGSFETGSGRPGVRGL
jgi:hypothetical protein